MGSPLNDNVPEGHSVAYVEFMTVDIFLNSKTQLDITVLLSKCILSVSCLLPRSTSKEGSRQKIMGACKNKVKQYVTVRKKKLYSPLIKTFFLASYDLFKFIVHDYGSHKTMFYCIAICGTWLSSYYRHFGYGISSKVGPN